MKLHERPEIINYGRENFKLGFTLGWNDNANTRRNYIRLKEKSRLKRFNEFFDYLEDQVWGNRRK